MYSIYGSRYRETNKTVRKGVLFLLMTFAQLMLLKTVWEELQNLSKYIDTLFIAFPPMSLRRRVLVFNVPSAIGENAYCLRNFDMKVFCHGNSSLWNLAEVNKLSRRLFRRFNISKILFIYLLFTRDIAIFIFFRPKNKINKCLIFFDRVCYLDPLAGYLSWTSTVPFFVSPHPVKWAPWPLLFSSCIDLESHSDVIHEEILCFLRQQKKHRILYYRNFC